MSNLSLADQYAALKIQAEELETQIKKLKAQIVATGRETIEGEDFKVTVGLQERPSIPVKEAEKILDPAIFAKLVKYSQYEVLRYKPIAH